MTAGLVVLGVYLIVRGLQFGVLYALEIILYKNAAFCGQFGNSRCTFFGPANVQNLVSFAANAVVILAGVWLVSRPSTFLDAVDRIASRRRESRPATGSDM